MEYTSDDIRRTALSLFIECSRRGIRPTPPDEPAATSPAPDSAPADEDDDLPF